MAAITYTPRLVIAAISFKPPAISYSQGIVTAATTYLPRFVMAALTNPCESYTAAGTYPSIIRIQERGAKQ